MSVEGKIRLAKLSMDGAAIHRFNLLHEIEDNLAWMPPIRDTTHSIELHKDAGSVSVSPCRCPHHHKEEIEKHVQDMLSQGIIRNNKFFF